MTKYILHGGFTKIDNDSNRTFFRELVLDVPDGGSILMVHFASRNENPMQDFEILKSKIRAEAGNKSLNFVYATKEDFVTQIKAADAVYIGGGSTNKLLEVLRSCEDLQPLLEGKTVAGSAPGAVQLLLQSSLDLELVILRDCEWKAFRF